MGGSRCRCVSSLRYVFLYSFNILFLTISCTIVHRLRVPPSILAIQRWRQHSTTMPSESRVITRNFSETPQKPLERPQDAPDTSKHRKKKTPIGRFVTSHPLVPLITKPTQNTRVLAAAMSLHQCTPTLSPTMPQATIVKAPSSPPHPFLWPTVSSPPNSPLLQPSPSKRTNQSSNIPQT